MNFRFLASLFFQLLLLHGVGCTKSSNGSAATPPAEVSGSDSQVGSGSNAERSSDKTAGQAPAQLSYGRLANVRVASCTGSDGAFFILDRDANRMSLRFSDQELIYENINLDNDSRPRTPIKGDDGPFSIQWLDEYGRAATDEDDSILAARDGVGSTIGLATVSRQLISSSTDVWMFENENSWEGVTYRKTVHCQFEFSK